MGDAAGLGEVGGACTARGAAYRAEPTDVSAERTRPERVAPVLITLLLMSCSFPYRTASSGETGCSRDAIVISDKHDGYGAISWAASCDDRTYQCTYVHGDVECTATDANEPTPEPAAEALPATPRETPDAVGGFAFGMSTADARSACEDGGHEWADEQAEHHTCSGTPEPVGYSAAARLRFCDDELCAVQLTVVPEQPGQWMDAFVDLRSALLERYGEPKTKNIRIPQSCSGESLAECVEAGTSTATMEWRWGNGAMVRYTLGRPSPNEGVAALRILYVVPRKQANAGAL